MFGTEMGRTRTKLDTIWKIINIFEIKDSNFTKLEHQQHCDLCFTFYFTNLNFFWFL